MRSRLALALLLMIAVLSAQPARIEAGRSGEQRIKSIEGRAFSHEWTGLSSFERHEIRDRLRRLFEFDKAGPTGILLDYEKAKQQSEISKLLEAVSTPKINIVRPEDLVLVPGSSISLLEGLSRTSPVSLVGTMNWITVHEEALRQRGRRPGKREAVVDPARPSPR